MFYTFALLISEP